MISVRTSFQLLATQSQCQPWQGLISILSYVILYWEFCRWRSTSEQTDDHQLLIRTAQHLITLMYLKISLWPLGKKATFKDILYFLLVPASQPRCSAKTRGPEFWWKTSGAIGANTRAHIFWVHPAELIPRPLCEITNVQGRPSNEASTDTC